MRWLGEPLGNNEALDPLLVRTRKDQIEEELFARRRDLFSSLDLVFFDTTSIYFQGEGGESVGQYGHSNNVAAQDMWRPARTGRLRHCGPVGWPRIKKRRVGALQLLQDCRQ